LEAAELAQREDLWFSFEPGNEIYSRVPHGSIGTLFSYKNIQYYLKNRELQKKKKPRECICEKPQQRPHVTFLPYYFLIFKLVIPTGRIPQDCVELDKENCVFARPDDPDSSDDEREEQNPTVDAKLDFYC
jgi:hypothetical protein